ncbi:hypothetical protein [Burkholderia gladioli]|nr:hypothetical protein [Burkholderia gladioli]
MLIDVLIHSSDGIRKLSLRLVIIRPEKGDRYRVNHVLSVSLCVYRP